MGWERNTGQWRGRDKDMKGVKKWSVGTYNVKEVEEVRGDQNDDDDDDDDSKLGWIINVGSKR
jgi:hypothetical protein